MKGNEKTVKKEKWKVEFCCDAGDFVRTLAANAPKKPFLDNVEMQIMLTGVPLMLTGVPHSDGDKHLCEWARKIINAVEAVGYIEDGRQITSLQIEKHCSGFPSFLFLIEEV